jgi:hypothetical protein
MTEPTITSGNAGGPQETGKAVYSFMDLVAKEAEQYAAGHTTPMSPVLEEIESYTLKESGIPACLPDGLKDASCS